MKKSLYLKNILTFTMVVALCTSAALQLSSCKKEETPTNTTKTLDKSKLIGKKWYTKGNTNMHEFRSGGGYLIDGSWRWINNSDTMEIIPSSGLSKELWKFYWSTDKEMACGLVGASEALYKDAPW